MSAAYAFFEASVHRVRRQRRWAALFMLVLSAVGGVWWMLEGQAGDRQMARILAGSLLCVPVALVVLATTFRRHRGLDALKDPAQIVWVYGLTRGSLITKIGIGTASGKLHLMELGDPRRGNEGMALVTQAAPHATVGYSESVRQTFKKNPGALRRG